MLKQTLTITPEDFENSGKSYFSPEDCPATIALNRQFGINATLWGSNVVEYSEDKPLWDLPIIGTISNEWSATEYSRVVRGITFETEITFQEEPVLQIS